MLGVRSKVPESDARSVSPLSTRTEFPRARLDPGPRTKYPGTAFPSRSRRSQDTSAHNDEGASDRELAAVAAVADVMVWCPVLVAAAAS